MMEKLGIGFNYIFGSNTADSPVAMPCQEILYEDPRCARTLQGCVPSRMGAFYCPEAASALENISLRRETGAEILFEDPAMANVLRKSIPCYGIRFLPSEKKAN